MIYLASAYTDFDRKIMEQNYNITVEAVARLLAAGHHVYSPIVHCHPAAIRYDIPHTFDFWLAYNHDFIDRADAVWILENLWWEKSKGVQEEITYARSLNKELKRVLVNATGEIKFLEL